MRNQTYKRLRKQTIVDPLDPMKTIEVRRWKALKDIPYHNVKKGDITGWLDAMLSPEADDMIWVNYDACVYGGVELSDRVLIGGTSIVRGPDHETKDLNYDPVYGAKLVLRGDVIIDDAAIVGYEKFPVRVGERFVIDGNVKIFTHSRLSWPLNISGNIAIYDYCLIGSRAKILGDVQIYNMAKIEDNVYMEGTIHVRDKAHLYKDVTIVGDLDVSDVSEIYAGTRVDNGKMTQAGIAPKKVKTLRDLVKFEDSEYSKWINPVTKKALTEKEDAYEKVSETVSKATTMIQRNKLASRREIAQSEAVSPVTLDKVEPTDSRSLWISKFNTVKDNIDSYETDIVKIIKYPIMADLTDDYTANMVFALKDAEVAMDGGEQDFIQAVTQLERKFLVAESNARKIAGTRFTDDERKKTELAKDLFALALDDATSVNEKKNALKQGFNRLEGIVAVPERAIEAMRIRVGIAELEM